MNPVDILEDCLREAGDDVTSGLLAAEYILSGGMDAAPAVQPISAFFSHDIENRRAQGILNRSLKAARSLSADARTDLAAALTRGPTDSGAAILAFIDKYRLQLARLLTQTQLASLLEGAREVAGKVPVLDADAAGVEALVGKIPQPTFPQQDKDGVHFPTIDEATRELAGKNVLTRANYDALDAAARAKAFTVAGVDAQETLEKIRDVLSKNVEQGADYATFKQEVLDAVDEGTFLSPAHMETVFRANVQTAFSDGQMNVLNNPLVRDGFPYADYDAIHDDRVRHNHLALEKLGIGGTNTYRIDDPVFQTFRPPWDYNDRCSWTPKTVRQAAEAGIKEAQQWLETGVEPYPPAFVPMPAFSPPPGFQRAVSSAPLSIRLSMQPMATFSPTPDPPTQSANVLNPDDYPRNAANQFVPKADIALAARDPDRLVELRESLPEEEQPKFDRAIAHLQWGGKIYHPKEPAGLAVGMDGLIADPRWAGYADLLALREAWETRDADRETRRDAAIAFTRLVRAVDVVAATRALAALHDGAADLSITEVRDRLDEALARATGHFDEVDSQLQHAGATPAEIRAVTRLRRQADAAIDVGIEAYVATLKRSRREGAAIDTRLDDRFDDLASQVRDSCARVTGLYEEVAEQAQVRVETEGAADPEPDAPEEPVNLGNSEVDMRLSTDATGHQHKGTGEGGGQFTGTSGGGNAVPDQKRSRTGAGIDKVKKAYNYLHDTGSAGFHRLPGPVQKAVSAVVSVVFAGWTASQKIAERISLEKGSTPEQAAQTRSVLAAWDLMTFKPVSVASLFVPVGAAAEAMWVVPPVTACYLAHSTVLHPIATYRAARGIVRDLVAGAKSATAAKPGPYSAFMATDAVGHQHKGKGTAEGGQFTGTGAGGGNSTSTTYQREPAKVENAKEWGDRYFGEWAKGITPTEKEAIDFYKLDSIILNDALRKERAFRNPKHDAHVRDLTQLIDRSSTPHDMAVHRGASKEFYGKLQVGQTFQDNGFISTSLGKAGTEDFGDVEIEIVIPKGSKAAYISQVNNDDNMNELLLQRGSEFKVAKVEGSRITITLLPRRQKNVS